MDQPDLENLVRDVVNSTLEHFATTGLTENELAVTLGVFDDKTTRQTASRDEALKLANQDNSADVHASSAARSDIEAASQGKTYVQASHRGDEKIYPASVVKLFYLAAAHRWLEDGRMRESEELERALKDMIVESSNDATQYVVDLLSDTTSGPELNPEEMKEWSRRRNLVNDYFRSQGFSGLNINQKPWGDGPYGRDREFVGRDYENRNLLTTNATAQLLCEIVERRCVNAVRSEQMLALLKRDRSIVSLDPDDQATKFCATHLSTDTLLWSKAGWTSKTRHDAAYIELAMQHRFIVVIFTTNHAKEYDIIPFVTSQIVEKL